MSSRTSSNLDAEQMQISPKSIKRAVALLIYRQFVAGEMPSSPRRQNPQRPQDESSALPREEKKAHGQQVPTILDEISEGWKRFKKDAGVVFLGDARRDISMESAKQKGVLSIQPADIEVGAIHLEYSYTLSLTMLYRVKGI